MEESEVHELNSNVFREDPGGVSTGGALVMIGSWKYDGACFAFDASEEEKGR